MDIACPNCAATYRVPDTLLAGGKLLRCAACGHEWVPQAPPPLGAEPEPPVPAEAMPAFLAAAAMATPEEPQAEPVEGQPFAQEASVPPLEALLASPLAPSLARPSNPSVPPLLPRRGPPHHGRGPLPEVRAAPRRATLLPIAWLMSIIVVALMALGLLLFREEIAQVWPPFARVAGV